MNLFEILCLMYLGLSRITCAPIDDKTTFYEAIVQKCPSLTSLPNVKEQTVFKSCNNWKKISQITNLTDDNKKDALCWLYFNAFTQYCNHMQQVNTSFSISKGTYDLNTVCDKLEVIPKQLDPTNSLHNIIKTADDCGKLCGDEVGLVESLCSISYYYNCQDNSSVNASNHFIHVGKHVTEGVKSNQEKVKSQPLENQEKTPLEIKSPVVKSNNEGVKPQLPENQEKTPPEIKSPVQKTNQTTEKNTDGNTEPHVETDTGDRTQDKVNADQSGTVKQAPAILSPQLVKGEDIPANNVEPPANENTNLVDGSSDVSPSKDKKQDSKKGTETENNAPAPPQLDVEQNIEEAPADKIPAEKTSDNVDLTNDQDMGPNNEDVMQPERPDFEEDVPEQPDIMPHEKPKPIKLDETEAVNYTTEMDGDSYFFTYFMLLCIIFIVGYVCYHNKQKILALILEGRKGKRQYRGRRPNSANYHKLDSNLEEAITSSCNKNTNNVIY